MKLSYSNALFPFVLFLCETFFPTDFDPISDPKERDSDSEVCHPKSDQGEYPGGHFLILECFRSCLRERSAG